MERREEKNNIDGSCSRTPQPPTLHQEKFGAEGEGEGGSAKDEKKFEGGGVPSKTKQNVAEICFGRVFFFFFGFWWFPVTRVRITCYLIYNAACCW